MYSIKIKIQLTNYEIIVTSNIIMFEKDCPNIYLTDIQINVSLHSLHIYIHSSWEVCCVLHITIINIIILLLLSEYCGISDFKFLWAR